MDKAPNPALKVATLVLSGYHPSKKSTPGARQARWGGSQVTTRLFQVATLVLLGYHPS